MTSLGRWPTCASRTVRRLAASAVLLALACSAPFAAGSELAGTRSHTHRLAATALPPSSFVETSRPRPGRHRKGSARGTANPTGASARSRPSRNSDAARAGNSPHSGRAANRTGRGRARQSEPVEDLMPMHRAGTRAARSGREVAHSVLPERRYGTRGGSHLQWHSGEQSFAVSARGRTAWNSRFSAMRASAPPLQWKAAHGSGQGFAAGESHPDDDERLPRDQGLASQANIGTAQIVVAAPIRTQSYTPPAPPQVVQGFGGEVAILPADPNVTRRRNHPIPAAALPGITPPATLEERDSITEAAVSPAVLPEIYDRDGRLLMPAPLKGSREVLIHQNTMAANDGLERIQDDGDLDRLRADHELVSFPASGALRVNEELPLNRRCARPWTVLFAMSISHDFYEHFHEPLQLTSAVRTVSYQARLQRVNGNAAATDGDAASPHLTGQAIDLAKRGMSAAEIAWMRGYLLPLMGAGKIDVEEEFQQACFHISVYRRYAGGRLPVHELAQARPGTRTQDAPGTAVQSLP